MEIISYGKDEMGQSKMKGGKYQINYLSLHHPILPLLGYAKAVVQGMQHLGDYLGHSEVSSLAFFIFPPSKQW